MPVGVCILCLQTKDLRDSHLLPAAVWRLLNEPGHRLRNPILMTEKIAVATSKQLHDFVLCDDCEQRFNHNGEAYAVSQMRGRCGFPLLERLRVAQWIGASGNVRMYSGSAIGVDTGKLAYVVWRAGAYEWRNPYSDKKTYSIDLGPFLEPIRQFLLGGAFPGNLSVNVQIATDDQSQKSAYAPVLAADSPIPIYGFLTCGIHFAVGLGNPLPPEYLETCCHNSAANVIFEKNLAGQSERAFNRLYATTRVAGQLRGN